MNIIIENSHKKYSTNIKDLLDINKEPQCFNLAHIGTDNINTRKESSNNKKFSIIKGNKSKCYQNSPSINIVINRDISTLINIDDIETKKNQISQSFLDIYLNKLDNIKLDEFYTRF